MRVGGYGLKEGVVEMKHKKERKITHLLNLAKSQKYEAPRENQSPKQ